MKILKIKSFQLNENSFVKVLKRLFVEYSTESSISGLKYVGERKRTVFERVIWFFSLIVLIAMCYYLIKIVWDKRKESPIIITFNDRQMSIWEIPFPAVTICPQTKTHASIHNYTKMYLKIMSFVDLTEKELYFHNAITQTCLDPNFVVRNDIYDVTPEMDILDPIRLAAPTLDETIVLCFWLGIQTNCSSIFEPIWTDEGICFSFNSLKSHYYRKEFNDARRKGYLGENFDLDQNLDWELEHGYNREFINSYPRRTYYSGDSTGLSIIMATRREDEDFVCRRGIQGYKVVLTTPGEEPNIARQYKVIPFEQSFTISARPTVIETSEDLRYIPVDRRQCYFQNERYLRYFTVYTQANCERECLANLTLRWINCTYFAMPRSTSHPICGHNRFGEQNSIYDTYFSLVNMAKYEPNKRLGIYRHMKCQSACYPTCTDIKYEAEIEMQVATDLRPMLKAFMKRYNYPIDDKTFMNRLTELKINFKKDEFYSFRRSELYSETDFIATCGGLLGLCMGVSIFSFVELVYYLTVKLCVSIAARNRVSDE